MVVELDPIGNHAAGMLQRLEAMAVYALLLERADDALDHPVPLRAMRRDELLTQTVAAYQGRVVAAREDPPVVVSQQERRRHAPERADAGRSKHAPTRSKLCWPYRCATDSRPAIAAYGSRSPAPERRPAIAASPHATHICRPALVRRSDDRRHGLNTWPEANWPFANLPAHQLEDPLHRILVGPQ